MHTLAPTRETLHGHWSPDLPPALVIDPGESVRFATLDAMWCARRPERGQWPWRHFEPRRPVLDDGHALTGPVAVRGARPGDTLEVAIGRIVPDTWGWTFSWPQGRRARDLGLEGAGHHSVLWDVDPAAMTAHDPASGRSFKLRPFMGVMGVAPPEPGVHSTTPPRRWGGNIDCRELTEGATLFLPVGVDGALFSTGDGHGLQGDGEVCGNAIECPMTAVDLTFRLRTDMPLTTPRARTKDGHWLTFGFGPTLDQAAAQATNDMLDLIQSLVSVSRQEALSLASLATDLRITQVVNQSQGVHCVLDPELLS